MQINLGLKFAQQAEIVLWNFMRKKKERGNPTKFTQFMFKKDT